MEDIQGSLFEQERDRMYEALREVRGLLDRHFPEYIERSVITVIKDDGTYLQPHADYNIIVLLRSAPTSDLERIASELPGRYERDGTIYSVHVEDADEHLESQLEARGL